MVNAVGSKIWLGLAGTAALIVLAFGGTAAAATGSHPQVGGKITANSTNTLRPGEGEHVVPALAELVVPRLMWAVPS